MYMRIYYRVTYNGLFQQLISKPQSHASLVSIFLITGKLLLFRQSELCVRFPYLGYFPCNRCASSGVRPYFRLCKPLTFPCFPFLNASFLPPAKRFLEHTEKETNKENLTQPVEVTLFEERSKGRVRWEYRSKRK